MNNLEKKIVDKLLAEIEAIEGSQRAALIAQYHLFLQAIAQRQVIMSAAASRREAA